MKRDRSGRVVVPGWVLVWSAVPVLLPAGLTLILALAAPWPRDIAPESGLKLAGFLATAVATLGAWRLAVRSVDDTRVRRLALVLCGMVGLLAWPVWTVGVLPSVNGAHLSAPRQDEMVLERTEATTKRRSPEFDHWAWLAASDAAGVPGGKYFIDPATYERLTRDAPDRVMVETATGLLGAVVVTDIR